MKANALKRVAGALSAAAVLVAGMALGTGTANAAAAVPQDGVPYIHMSGLTEANSDSSTWSLYKIGDYVSVDAKYADVTTVANDDVKTLLREAIEAGDPTGYKSDIYDKASATQQTYYDNPVAYISQHMGDPGYAEKLRKIADALADTTVGTGLLKNTGIGATAKYQPTAGNIADGDVYLTPKQGGSTAYALGDFSQGVYVITSNKTMKDENQKDVNAVSTMIVPSTYCSDASSTVKVLQGQQLGEVALKSSDGNTPDKKPDPVEPDKDPFESTKKGEVVWSDANGTLVKFTLSSSIPSNWSANDANHNMKIYDAPRAGVTVLKTIAGVKDIVDNNFSSSLTFDTGNNDIKKDATTLATAEDLTLKVGNTTLSTTGATGYSYSLTYENTVVGTDDDNKFVGQAKGTGGEVVSGILEGDKYFVANVDQVMKIPGVTASADVVMTYYAFIESTQSGAVNDYLFKFDGTEAGKDEEQRNTTVDYTLYNVGPKNNYIGVKDATYRIYKVTVTPTNRAATLTYAKGNLAGEVTSAADGSVKFPNLTSGYYIVEETKVATGYLQSFAPTYTIQVTGKTGTGVSAQYGKLAVAAVAKADAEQMGNEFYKDLGGLLDLNNQSQTPNGRDYVHNVTSLTQLPMTGGAGIALSVVVALVLGGFGLASYRRSRKAASVVA
ncbi:SpaA isopeptide-forming pilin-related protein [Bifidobacterium eulemuris]|uniref:Cell surface protein n=1 Tax=Bifidobacterium eulemuris TaxID=1765219 RepID=A0A261GEE4_9BIFI|nr:SpaA isopeptide-forming pilin-related protein [Bifidobacterium eulemuris]OZG69603.1 cell surface protein [Bifidobacterium eulemuris]QOL32280.1 prealbumin-like fold domain-containing protein [Bifidobacterium eulemuris]